MFPIKLPEKAVREKIGLHYIFERLELKTPYGLDELRHLKPFKREEIHQLEATLADLREMCTRFVEKERAFKEVSRILLRFRNIRATVGRLSMENILDDIEFFELKSFAMTLSDLMEAYEEMKLSSGSIEFDSLKELVELLNPYEKIVPSFYVHDTYSEALKEIRERKKELESAIIAQNAPAKQDELREQRNAVVIREREEERKVRHQLTSKAISFRWLLESNANAIGKLELLMAKAKISFMYPSSCPEVFDDRTGEAVIELTEALNPMMMDFLRHRKREFVPVSIDIKQGATIVTGANMGGKTVALSTVVLNAILASLGFFVFAKSMRMPLPDFIAFISGDMQDQEKGISSFGAECLKLSEVCAIPEEKKGLVVFDEFARTTNPGEGQKFVSALCDYLLRRRCFGLLSTHYDGIEGEGAQYYQVVGLKHADFEEMEMLVRQNRGRTTDILSAYMDYRLVKTDKSHLVPKDALKIAKTLQVGEVFLGILEKKYDKP